MGKNLEIDEVHAEKIEVEICVNQQISISQYINIDRMRSYE